MGSSLSSLVSGDSCCAIQAALALTVLWTVFPSTIFPLALHAATKNGGVLPWCWTGVRFIADHRCFPAPCPRVTASSTQGILGLVAEELCPRIFSASSGPGYVRNHKSLSAVNQRKVRSALMWTIKLAQLSVKSSVCRFNSDASGGCQHSLSSRQTCVWQLSRLLLCTKGWPLTHLSPHCLCVDQ